MVLCRPHRSGVVQSDVVGVLAVCARHVARQCLAREVECKAESDADMAGGSSQGRSCLMLDPPACRQTTATPVQKRCPDLLLPLVMRHGYRLRPWTLELAVAAPLPSFIRKLPSILSLLRVEHACVARIGDRPRRSACRAKFSHRRAAQTMSGRNIKVCTLPPGGFLPGPDEAELSSTATAGHPSSNVSYSTAALQ